MIRELAHQLWEERGKPEGSAEDDWLEAERRLLQGRRAASKAVDESAKESFPASDPPASGLPDKPPANAEAKWAAAAKTKRRRKRANVPAPVETPSSQNEGGSHVPDEVPKVGSRDAPGG
jgi:hypothetical protein